MNKKTIFKLRRLKIKIKRYIKNNLKQNHKAVTREFLNK